MQCVGENDLIQAMIQWEAIFTFILKEIHQWLFWPHLYVSGAHI